MTHRRQAIAATLAVALALGTFAPSASEGVVDPSTGVLDNVPPTTPAGLGDIDLSELQYGDPGENLALVQPPAANNNGTAELSHPLLIPPGRAGIQPSLSLNYNSGGGTGWVGTGWDLSVGAVSLDTTYGAPRYLADKESETYVLDGDRLFPNAISSTLASRNTTGVKDDFVRQVETDYERIIRHGTSPSTYYWQVTDKNGTDRWYGGSPLGRQESAILTASATVPGGTGGDSHWALSYVEDINGNVVRYFYDEVTNVPIGRAPASGPGVSLYLRTITYTGSVASSPAVDRPPYRVTFLRDGDIPGSQRRPDITVDARSGMPVVTRDLLRGVEVHYLAPGDAPTAAGTLVRGYRLEYDTDAPFDKSLLTRVGQYGSGGRNTVHAWHDFDWFDEVTSTQGTTPSYAGFGPPQQWDKEAPARTDEVNIAATSALGSSGRGGGDGGAYIGFNPVVPSKIGSFGGSFNIAGGQSDELSMLVDLNGDGLPDKVTTSGGTVYWHRNLSTPSTAPTQGLRFADGRALSEIDSLGRARDIRVNLHLEAYPVASIQVGGGFGFSIGERYFEDVNGDGRPDFIRPDKDNPPHQIVYFNVLDANGVPRFVDSSAQTAVPVEDFNSAIAHSEIEEIRDILVDSSPRIDTVRRWIAPFDGRVRVQGTPALALGSSYTGDGARVMVEHRNTRRFDATLTASTPGTTHDIDFQVDAGEAVYFRVHVIENGTNDLVKWSPTITYVGADGTTPTSAAPDANGRSQVVYNAAADFTLFGRNGARTAVTDAGPATLKVILARTGRLSDDVEVVVRHRRNSTGSVLTPTPTEGEPAVLPAGAADSTPESVVFTYPLTIDAPGTISGEAADPDWVELDVITDSPVDPRAFSVEVEFTTTPTGPSTDPTEIEGVTIPGAAAPAVIPNVRVFARTSRSSPYTPYGPSDDGTVALNVRLDGAPLRSQSDEESRPTGERVRSTAVITVKTADDGVIARSSPFTVQHQLTGSPIPAYRLAGSGSLSFDVDDDEDYWVEVSIHDPVVGAAVGLTSSATLEVGDEDPVDVTVPVQAHRPDKQGMFPSGNRGWGLAGYNADHPDASGAGVMNTDQFDLAHTIGGDFDEDTPVPEAADLGAPEDVTGDPKSGFPGAYPYIAWSGFEGGPADRWRAAEKETLFGDGTTQQSARLGEEVAIAGGSTDGRPAPEKLSITGDFNFAIGLVASISAAAGGGRALRDYLDLNGDGFPDIRSGSSVEFTGPRGARSESTTIGNNTFDTSVAVGGGLGGSPVSIGGGEKTVQGSSGKQAGVTPTSKRTVRGMNLGLGINISSQWTNPLPEGEADEAFRDLPGDAPDVSSPATSGETGDANARGTLIERALLDINGDGLPDRVDTYSSGELWVNLGLGYRFADNAVRWSSGRVKASKDIAGTLSAGFQINNYEFGGGIAYTEGVGLGQLLWADIDGDGVPDRMEHVSGTAPQTVFGAGDGMERSEVTYGAYAEGEVAVDAANAMSDVDLGQQMAVSRATGLAGGADITFYIGPICLVACYVIINPGIHGGYDRSTTQISMVDMDGDGYPDVVKSTDDEHVEVRLNLRGRTNLLRGVTNPLGGKLRLDYSRQGNTVEQPKSLWVMSSVEVDDGRPGDGKSIQRSEFEYAGNVYDRLHRTLLGFSSVIERQYATKETHIYPEDGQPVEPLQTTLLRSYERSYRNGSPFESGLMTQERLLDASGALLERTRFTWQLVRAEIGTDLGTAGPTLPAVGTPERLLLFDLALAPRLAGDDFLRVDAEGDRQETAVEYTHDANGNVIRVVERNELETLDDDTVTLMTYSPCLSPRSAMTIGNEGSWVQVPATVTVRAGNASGPIVRHRDGSLDLCINGVPRRIIELQGTDACGNQIHAVTELGFDQYGSYDAVRYPTNALVGIHDPADCSTSPPPPPPPTGPATFDHCDPSSAAEADRYCVDYVYDPHRFTDVGTVTDNHGVTSTATYDPLTGRMASRTDENGNVSEYRYDPQGRLRHVVAPRERTAFLAGSGPATVTYAYGLPAGGHAWSVARHHDAFNADGNEVNDTIDTAAFVDGIGRVVQRKRDAKVEAVDGPAVIVEGAVDFDALGREVRQWYPVVEPAAAWPASGLPAHLTVYNTWTSSLPTATTNVPVTQPTVLTYDALDRLLKTTLPDGSVETIAYDIAEEPSTGLTVFATTTTDPLKKATRRYVDIRGLTLGRHDAPAPTALPGGADMLATLPVAGIASTPRISPSVGTGENPLVTRYAYDVLGRLTSVVDPAGAQTTHTYDLLDNRTSTTTPDGGRVEQWFTPAGAVAREVDEVRRALGTAVVYRYDRDRLRTIEYPDATPSVAYVYGGADAAADNARGRVVRVEDGSMVRGYTYDVDGNVASEKATRQPEPFGRGSPAAPGPFTTSWTYDSLGRLRTLTYPEGEALTHEYDLGGMPARLHASVPQPDLYDRAGTPVPSPDLAVTYVEEVRYDEFQKPRFLRTGTGVHTRWDHEPTRRFLTGVTTDSTAAPQFDGTTSTARQLQRLAYTYDRVGNVRDVANALYNGGSATSLNTLGAVPENNVPGPAQHAYTYDGHYRLTGAVARYVDRQEDRDYTYTSDYAPNGNLLSKSQVTTTTGTTGGGKGKGKGPGGGAKKGDGSTVPEDGSSTQTTTCDGNTGSGGGSDNQDRETTYVLSPDSIAYDPAHPHRLVKAGDRTYSFDHNGNLSKWVQPCSGGNKSELVRELRWDAENRLVYIGQGNNDTDYRYNAEGARTLERGPGGTIWFVNEHWRVENDGHRYASVFLGEMMVASHRSSPPPPPPPPCDPDVEDCGCDPAKQVCDCEDPSACGCDPTRLQYDETTGTCRPLPDLTIHYFHTDLQGSLRVATDARGGVFQYLEYLPSGQTWVAGQSRIKDTPYLFAGGWTDITYGLVNFGKRWYEPREEQFYSPEPMLEEEPGSVVNDPALLSAYTYAASNPLRYVDRDGRAPYDLGVNNSKHLQGTFTVSDQRRAARPSPAITFGGRYSNDRAGQQRQATFQKYSDRASRFTTILSIETDRKRVRLFGITLTKQPAPNPGPASTGATQTAPKPKPPSTPSPRAATAAAQPAPAPVGSGAAGGQGGGAGGASGAPAPNAASPPPAASGAQGAAGANDLAIPATMPPLPPLPASAAAPGPTPDE